MRSADWLLVPDPVFSISSLNAARESAETKSAILTPTATTLT